MIVITLAKRPAVGNFAESALRCGLAGLNISRCRLPVCGEEIHLTQSTPLNRKGVFGTALWDVDTDKDKFREAQRASIERTNTLGRWPANIILSPAATPDLDQQSGESISRASEYNWEEGNADNPVRMARNIKSGVHFEDAGGASRYFKVVG